MDHRFYSDTPSSALENGTLNADGQHSPPLGPPPNSNGETAGVKTSSSAKWSTYLAIGMIVVVVGAISGTVGGVVGENAKSSQVSDLRSNITELQDELNQTKQELQVKSMEATDTSEKGASTLQTSSATSLLSSASECELKDPSSMKTNDKALATLKHHEGWRPECYSDPVGIITVGFGHACFNSRSGVCACNRPLTRQEGEDLLRKDLERFEKCVKDYISVPLTSNMFSALVSFSFNVGCGALKTSTLRRKLNNNGDYDSVPSELNRWVHGGGRVLPGLVRRRKDEGELFQDGKCTTPDDGETNAGSDSEWPPSWPVLKKDDNAGNAAVVALQYLLREKGCPRSKVSADPAENESCISLTKIFDQQTQDLVLLLQGWYGVNPRDGVVREDLWEILTNLKEGDVTYLEEGDGTTTKPEDFASAEDYPGNHWAIRAIQHIVFNDDASERTGYFNSDTTAQVKQFQGNNNIVQNGYVGKTTWRFLLRCDNCQNHDDDGDDNNDGTNPEPRKFQSGEISGFPDDTSWSLGSYNKKKGHVLQLLIRNKLCPQTVTTCISFTGAYDEQTKGAIEDLEESENLPRDDGKVANHIWFVLTDGVILQQGSGGCSCGDCSAQVNANCYKDNHWAVRAVQQVVLDPAEVDDHLFFDSHTKAQVIAFQQANQLTADGIVGPQTWRLIAVGDPDLENEGSATSLDCANPHVNYGSFRVSSQVVRNALEKISCCFGGSEVRLTSGDRSSGSNPGSLHLRGRAADFWVPGYGFQTQWEKWRTCAVQNPGSFNNMEHIYHGISTCTGGRHLHIGHYLDSRATTWRTEGVSSSESSRYPAGRCRYIHSDWSSCSSCQ